MTMLPPSRRARARARRRRWRRRAPPGSVDAHGDRLHRSPPACAPPRWRTALRRRPSGGVRLPARAGRRRCAASPSRGVQRVARYCERDAATPTPRASRCHDTRVASPGRGTIRSSSPVSLPCTRRCGAGGSSRPKWRSKLEASRRAARPAGADDHAVAPLLPQAPCRQTRGPSTKTLQDEAPLLQETYVETVGADDTRSRTREEPRRGGGRKIAPDGRRGAGLAKISRAERRSQRGTDADDTDAQWGQRHAGGGERRLGVGDVVIGAGGRTGAKRR